MKSLAKAVFVPNLSFLRCVNLGYANFILALNRTNSSYANFILALNRVNLGYVILALNLANSSYENFILALNRVNLSYTSLKHANLSCLNSFKSPNEFQRLLSLSLSYLTFLKSIFFIQNSLKSFKNSRILL